jgi:hypothetical protein
MKKTYETPELTVHGTVEDLTQALGSSSAADYVIIGGRSFGHPLLDGSQDFVIKP